MIDNSHRAILSGDIDPATMRLYQDALSSQLSDILSADVHIEDVSQREVDEGLDPTGSDVLFYAIDPDTGDPWEGVRLVE